MSGLTDAFLRKVHKVAVQNAKLQRQLSEAMIERYGVTHSDIDCDRLIDALDYGTTVPPTLADCDAMMAECGAYPQQGAAA